LLYFNALSAVPAGGTQLLENRGGVSGQKHTFVVDVLQFDTSRAVPLISLEQVVQKELVVALAGVINNAPLRSIAPTLPSINILFFFIAVLSFSNRCTCVQRKQQLHVRVIRNAAFKMNGGKAGGKAPFFHINLFHPNHWINIKRATN